MKGINSVVTAPAAAAAASKRKPAAAKEKKPKKIKGTTVPKSRKDPNLPKKPATAFILFMSEFRTEYKKANPDSKGITGAAKAGGEKWKSMSDREKEAYVSKAAALKTEYQKELADYEQKIATEGSGETKSEIADDAEDSTLDGQ